MQKKIQVFHIRVNFRIKIIMNKYNFKTLRFQTISFCFRDRNIPFTKSLPSPENFFKFFSVFLADTNFKIIPARLYYSTNFSIRRWASTTVNQIKILILKRKFFCLGFLKSNIINFLFFLELLGLSEHFRRYINRKNFMKFFCYLKRKPSVGTTNIKNRFNFIAVFKKLLKKNFFRIPTRKMVFMNCFGLISTEFFSNFIIKFLVRNTHMIKKFYSPKIKIWFEPMFFSGFFCDFERYGFAAFPNFRGGISSPPQAAKCVRTIFRILHQNKKEGFKAFFLVYRFFICL